MYYITQNEEKEANENIDSATQLYLKDLYNATETVSREIKRQRNLFTDSEREEVKSRVAIMESMEEFMAYLQTEIDRLEHGLHQETRPET